jgi:hypothetical protein
MDQQFVEEVQIALEGYHLPLISQELLQSSVEAEVRRVEEYNVFYAKDLEVNVPLIALCIAWRLWHTKEQLATLSEPNQQVYQQLDTQYRAHFAQEYRRHVCSVV